MLPVLAVSRAFSAAAAVRITARSAAAFSLDWVVIWLVDIKQKRLTVVTSARHGLGSIIINPIKELGLVVVGGYDLGPRDSH